MKNSKGFSLIHVIIIIVVTSIASAITAGVIVTNNYGISFSELSSDGELEEFLKTYSNIVQNYYKDIDKKAMLDSATEAMLNYLDDNYTTYLNTAQSKDLEQQLSGTYEGVGITIQGRIIKEVTKNGPAEAAGLLPGDEIIKIDDQDVTNLDHNAIGILIKTRTDKKVSITITREGYTYTFQVELKTLTYPAVSYKMVEGTDVGYLQMTIFSKTLTSQVNDALKELKSQGMKKLIIDVRDNIGGYLDIAESTASLFLEKGKVIYSLENKDSKQSYYDKTATMADYPIVVIVNENSASAAEILASALKDSYGATIVGVTSYGKGKVQQTYEREDGSLAKYTSAKWLRPNGECIDGVGVKPDYEVNLNVLKDEEGNEYIAEDSQLLKAIEVINAID